MYLFAGCFIFLVMFILLITGKLKHK